MTTIIKQTRAPPVHVAGEAKAIATQNTAGRVVARPDGSGGWKTIVEGAKPENGPDNPPTPWDKGADILDETSFNGFSDVVDDITSNNRKQITKTYDLSGKPDMWRITVNYDETRGPQ